MLSRPTIFLADAQTLFCELLAQALSDRFDVVGFARDGQSAVSDALRLEPDVVILDVFMPLLNGLDAARRIREAAPSTRVVFLTMNADAGIARNALKSGAAGFLLKTSPAAELHDAIWDVLRGNRYVTPSMVDLVRDAAWDDEPAARLTTREREVIQLLAEGQAMKQVAEILNVSARTVAFHKYRVMRRFGLRSSAEVVRLAVAQGLVPENLRPRLLSAG